MIRYVPGVSRSLARQAGSVAVLAVITIAAIACESDVYDGPHTTACSSGPPLDRNSVPSRPSGWKSNIPECVPRCGAEEKFPFGSASLHSIAALPSGHCPQDGEECGMAATLVQSCPGRPAQGCDLSTYGCRCEGGDWRCYVVSQGAGSCGECAGPGARDAGVSDAGGDG